MKQFGVAPDELTVRRYVVNSWEINHKNSCVGFSIEQFNLVSRPFRRIKGKFEVYAGAIQAMSGDFQEAKIDFSVIAGSINTGNDKRDKHLRSAAFFAAEQFPVMRFRSVAFIKVSNHHFVLEGDLMLHGISRRIAFDVIQQQAGSEANLHAAQFIVTGKLNRIDFDIRGTMLSEIFVGKEVTISLQLEFLKLEI
jgi:polyisoprenoid-binding protein YceI